MDKHYHGHRARLREDLERAPHGLRDYEVLELLLGKVITRKDTKPLAKELLTRFHSIKGALDAKNAELMSIDGFGPALLNYWLLLREVMARYAESPLRQKASFSSAGEIAAMARMRLAGRDHEEIWLAFLDAQNHLISWELGNKGGVGDVGVHIQEILSRCLQLKAVSFILAHNHPGGDATLSAADIQMTSALKRAARPLQLRLVDHIVVTDTEFRSMAQEGLI